jgi:transcriptional regulator with GAF, ATPase, and Fis domain
VIIARNGKLNLRDVLPLASLQPIRERRGGIAVDGLQTKKDLREAEKATLLRALEEAKWKVAGPHGAAQKLGIPPSTLSSRMKVLRIVRPQ